MSNNEERKKVTSLELFLATCLALIFIGGGYYLATQKNDTTTPALVPIAKVYTTTTANVRSCASTNCSIIGTYPPNESFDLADTQYSSTTDMSQLPDWILLTFSDGTSGYISKTVLSASQTQAEATQQEPTPVVSTPSLPSTISEWRKRTAYVECDWDYNNNTASQAYYSDSGSGMLVYFSDDDLTVLTNAHVVDNSTYGAATACYVKFPDDTGAYGPVIYPNITTATDGTDDGFLKNIIDSPSYGSVAMTLKKRAGTHVSVCTSPEQIGDKVVVIGYPDYGSAISAVGGIEVTATEGIISGKDGLYYTTSALIEHGNSGGLAIDEANDCYIGIPSAFVTGQAGSLGRILPASVVGLTN